MVVGVRWHELPGFAVPVLDQRPSDWGGVITAHGPGVAGGSRSDAVEFGDAAELGDAGGIRASHDLPTPAVPMLDQCDSAEAASEVAGTDRPGVASRRGGHTIKRAGRRPHVRRPRPRAPAGSGRRPPASTTTNTAAKTTITTPNARILTDKLTQPLRYKDAPESRSPTAARQPRITTPQQPPGVSLRSSDSSLGSPQPGAVRMGAVRCCL
jgi:hypothetical protein